MNNNNKHNQKRFNILTNNIVMMIIQKLKLTQKFSIKKKYFYIIYY